MCPELYSTDNATGISVGIIHIRHSSHRHDPCQDFQDAMQVRFICKPADTDVSPRRSAVRIFATVRAELIHFSRPTLLYFDFHHELGRSSDSGGVLGARNADFAFTLR